MSWLSKLIDKVLPGAPAKNFTENTFDKWIAPEHKDAVEAVAAALAAAGAIPGITGAGGLISKLSTATGIPPQALTGALSNPSNPLAGALLQGLPAVGGNIGKFAGTNWGQAVIKSATGDTKGAMLTALGGLPDKVGDFFKTDKGKALGAQLVGAASGGGANLTSLLGMLPGDVGEYVKNNPSVANALTGFLGGDFLKGASVSNFDLGKLGDFGKILGQMVPDGKLDDYLRDYGIPIGLALTGEKAASRYYNAADQALTNQAAQVPTYMNPYNTFYNMKNPVSPTKLTGFSPNTGQSLTNAILNSASAQDPNARQVGRALNVFDVSDVPGLKASFGTAQGDPGYNQRFDLNQDNVVDVEDFARFKQQFGLTDEEATALMRTQGDQQGQPLGAQGLPQFGLTEPMDPWQFYLNKTYDTAINGYATDEARLMRNYMMEGVDKNYLEQLNALENNLNGRYGLPGASSGTRLDMMNKLAENIANQKAGIDRSLFLQGEDLKRNASNQLGSTAMSMMGMPLNAASTYGNIANINSVLGNQAGQQWANLANAIAYASGMAKYNNSTNVNVGVGGGNSTPAIPGVPDINPVTGDPFGADGSSGIPDLGEYDPSIWETIPLDPTSPQTPGQQAAQDEIMNWYNQNFGEQSVPTDQLLSNNPIQYYQNTVDNVYGDIPFEQPQNPGWPANDPAFNNPELGPDSSAIPVVKKKNIYKYNYGGRNW